MDRRICMDKVFGINFRSYWMGISICMVMLLHIVMYRSSDEFLFRTLKMLFLQGDAGVNVFFFLSAYGLCHSLENNSINKYYRNRRKEDELFAVTCRCRRRIQNFIKKSGYKKTSKTFEMIGCTPEQLLEHLHKTWYDNYGTEYNGEPVHIDHIIPLSSAETEEDMYKLCHYTNLQYLKPEDNLAKSDSILQTI